MKMKVIYFAPAILALLSLEAAGQPPAGTMGGTRTVGPVAGTRPGFDPGLAPLVEMPLAGLPGMAPAGAASMRMPAGTRTTINFPCRVSGTVAIPSGSPGPTIPEPPCGLLLDSEMGILSLTVPQSYVPSLRGQLAPGGAAASKLANCQSVDKGRGRRLMCNLRNIGEVIIAVSGAIEAVAGAK